jgi:hypothetical protein
MMPLRDSAPELIFFGLVCATGIQLLLFRFCCMCVCVCVHVCMCVYVCVGIGIKSEVMLMRVHQQCHSP